MTTTTAPAPAVEPRPIYELVWHRNNQPMTLQSRDPQQIITQMEALALRGIAGKAYIDGFPAAAIGVMNVEAAPNDNNTP